MEGERHAYDFQTREQIRKQEWVSPTSSVTFIYVDAWLSDWLIY